MSSPAKTVLWWGRFDPDYSRNRVLRQAYAALGWQVRDFHPWFSPLADLEARLRQQPRADLVHVPCFRQRDIAAAHRYAQRHGLPLLIDPLISAYDKQVFERAKFAPDSNAARHLRTEEGQLFRLADGILADTEAHANFYAETFEIERSRLHTVYVGAEEPLFTPGPARVPNEPLEILFFGSFISLQGPAIIVEAARVYAGPPVRWVLLGAGPLLAECRRRAAGLAQVQFEPWLPYAQLPERIRRADILLGIFGSGNKAGRVIPNKVFQALACGKPLITRAAPAYPTALEEEVQHGIHWVAPADAAALAQAIASLAQEPEQLAAHGAQARRVFEKYFSAAQIRAQLQAALAAIVQH